MIPVNPTSVKYPPEMLERAKKDAALLGYTFGKYVRECLAAIDKMVDDPMSAPPQIVLLLKVARDRSRQDLSPPESGSAAPGNKSDSH